MTVWPCLIAAVGRVRANWSKACATTDCTATATPSALTVKAPAGGALPGAMSRSSLKVTVSVLPFVPTSPLSGTGGVTSTVELLVASK